MTEKPAKRMVWGDDGYPREVTVTEPTGCGAIIFWLIVCAAGIALYLFGCEAGGVKP